MVVTIRVGFLLISLDLSYSGMTERLTLCAVPESGIQYGVARPVMKPPSAGGNAMECQTDLDAVEMF